MNKYFLGVLSIFSLLSSNALAQNTYTPYVGIGAAYHVAKVSKAKPHYFGGNLQLGTMYNPYFGTELFYEQTASDTKKMTDTQKLKTSYRTYGLDAFGYLPLGCDNRFSVLGGLGFGHYVTRQKISAHKHKNNSGYAYRFHLGAIYHLSEHIALRPMASYETFKHISNFNHQFSYSVSLRYYFTEGK